MSRNTTKSPFAEALEGLLDATELYTRREWAKLLGIKDSAISQWLSEETIPRASNLNMIYVTVEKASDAAKEPLEVFRKMAADLPALEASPKNGRRMLPNVWAYMKRPVFDKLSNELAKLSPAEQEKLLEDRFLSETKSPVVEEVEPTSAGAEGIRFVPIKTKPRVSTHSVGHMTGLGSSHTRTQPSLLSDAPVAPAMVPFLAPTFRLHADDKQDEPVGPIIEWEQIAQKTTRLVLFGTPGSGKTCFLTHLCRAFKEKAEWAVKMWPGRVPAYVAMHRLPAIETTDDLWGVISEIVATPLRDRVVLLLDGFDEVPIERRKGLAQAIKGLQETNPHTAIVITSRPTPDVRALGRMTRCSLQTHSDSRLLMLAYNRTSSAVADSERWGDALLQVGSSFRERPDVLRALGNPLLLSYAARLFAKRALTACRDSDLIDSCLTFLFERWDEEKEVIRSRSAWTSTSSNALYQRLGGLCYHSLVHNASEFTREHIAQWFSDSPERIPMEADLKAIAESTGVIEPAVGNGWRIVHQTIREYLAARYVVESSRDATAYLRAPVHESWVSSVLQFACSITHDATPLLTFVLETPCRNRANKMATLAGMVAQQLRASDDVLERSCDNLVELLEESFTDWRLANTEEESEVFPEPKWRLAARCKQSQKSTTAGPCKQVLQTIKAVHRARLSPAKGLLSKRLAGSTNEVIRDFGKCLDVEGYMEGRSFTRGESDIFAAEVCEI